MVKSTVSSNWTLTIKMFWQWHFKTRVNQWRFSVTTHFLQGPSLPASLMISAIQYTLVERLVSELTTSTLTPSSMSPQHFPIGAWKSPEERSKSLHSTVRNQVSQQNQQHFDSHAWNSWLVLQLCYCYRCTDPSQSSLQGPLQGTRCRLEPVDNNTGRQHHSSVEAHQLLIWTGSVDLLGIGRKQPTLPWEAVSAKLLLFLLVVCPKLGF